MPIPERYPITAGKSGLKGIPGDPSTWYSLTDFRPGKK